MKEAEPSMGEHDDDLGEEEEDEGKKEITLTREDFQKRLDRVGTKEHRAGVRKGRAELLEELGVDTEDDLKSIVAKHAEANDEESREVKDKLEDADRRQRAAKQAEAEAKRDRLMGRVEGQLLRAGLDDKAAAKAARMIDLDELGDDADSDDIREAIEELQTDFPALFKSDTSEEGEEEEGGEGEQNPPPKGTRERPPRPAPKPKGGGKRLEDRVKDRLEKRHPAAKESAAS